MSRDWRFHHIDFSTYPVYQGDDLGVTWHSERTTFKIWAPTAVAVELNLYRNGKDGSSFQTIKLTSGMQGTWEAVVDGNLEGIFYTFRINDGNWLDEVPDIYTRCVGVNGKRGMVYDPEKTNPSGWQHDLGPRLNSFTEAIIYEIHVRDFSVDAESGIINSGLFLGFTETGTSTTDGIPTGIDHLKDLGITHLHLLPVNDFFTVDEEFPLEKYNWGYDPLHYNALEGSYSTNPYDGRIRIREFKKMVQTLHNNGIGVILDVVYNHTGHIGNSVFNQTVPGYFYRQNPDGSFSNASGCGTEIASERAMVRKYIIDSLKYWVREFHADGFRFDLMGIFDLDTMNTIRRELDQIDPGILIYGEGWAADQSPMPEELRAVKRNLSLLPGIAVFDDDLRDALKGHWSDEKSKGFISGLTLREEAVKFGIVGATYHPQIVYDYVESSRIPWAAEPNQCINYVSCHDNYTLWDKLKLSCPDASDAEMRKMVKLAGAILLTSQGIPFLHAGAEFCRTKKGHPNSYRSPDKINKIHWRKKGVYLDVYEYYRSLITLRKNHPAFHMPTARLIRENLSFCFHYEPGVIAYCINGKAVGDKWERIIVVFNGNRGKHAVQLPKAKYTLVVSGDHVDENGIKEIQGREFLVDGISAAVLISEDKYLI